MFFFSKPNIIGRSQIMKKYIFLRIAFSKQKFDFKMHLKFLKKIF